MSVAVGDTVGSFEVLGLLGNGGMGEVFRARDARLGRTVALKFVTLDLAGDPDARLRLEREARAVAGLSHPNICAIHDIGEHNGSPFLVMECLEGETLASRLQRGPLSGTEVLDLGMAIADALALAHRAGIAHRDIKAANIMLTPRGPKLLDFGLARVAGKVQPADATVSLQTAPQSILGTLPYMAPEQLRGEVADHRADIFSFGVVLFEAITGRRPFEAATTAELIGAILKDSPARLEPAALDRVVRSCLVKEREQRWQSIHDVGLELAWLRERSADTVAPAVRGRSRWPLALGTAAAVALVLAVLAWTFGPVRDRMPGLGGSPPDAAKAVRLSITLDRGQSFGLRAQPSIDISFDGSTVAFVASRDGISQLFIRRLDQAEATPLPGTAGATVPFFSADGQWVGFGAEGRLRKIAVAGGAPITLCDALELQGADWIDSQTIVFAPNTGGELWTVPSAGGTPTRLTTLDRQANETSHRWPRVRQDGQVLFAVSGSSFARLEVVDLKTKVRRTFLDKASAGRYLRPDLLLFSRARQLFTIGLDASGQPIMDTVAAVRETPFMTGTGTPFLSVSNDGTLVYLPAEADGARRSLSWVDRNGQVDPLAAPRRKYANPQVSPDGRRVVSRIVDGANSDLWLYDIVRGALTQLTTDGEASGTSAWSPDGQSLLYSAGSRGSALNLTRRRVDGSGAVDQLAPQPFSQWPGTWLTNGTATFMQFSPDSLGDIYLLELAGLVTRPLISQPATQWGGRVSADGEWIAYVSNETGTFEAFVAKMDEPARRWQVSVGGGHEVAWSRTGLELFYRTDNAMMASTIDPLADVPVGRASQVFQGPYLFEPSGPGLANYDVGPDGRFLMIVRDDAAESISLRVVTNWTQTLSQGGSAR